MATNDFLVFGGGAGANVMTQADWAALAARVAGFSSGVAQSAQLNKAWRQSSIMAAVLAQFIVDQTGLNAVDDGSTATLLANLKSATTGRLLRTTIYTNPSGTQLVSVDGGAPTSSGASTFTALAATKFVEVEVQGGGGGGGGVPATGGTTVAASGGGGEGSYAKGRFTSGLVGVAITVGTAGAGGAAGQNAGGNGGTSSFGALISAPGGIGGQSTAATAPPTGRGGSSYAAPPSGGNLISRTGAPGGGTLVVSGTVGLNSPGAPSMFGGAGITGGDAGGPGAGGGGLAQFNNGAATAGGKGGPGLVIVREYA